jgi:magnesium chelatase family protein
MKPVDDALGKGQLTARGMDRVLRVAWTLADLDGEPVPTSANVAEAVNYRRLAA